MCGRRLRSGRRGVQGSRDGRFQRDRLCETFGLLRNEEPAAFCQPIPLGLVATGDLLSAITAEQGEQDVDAGDLEAFVRRVAAGHVIPAKDAAAVKRESDQVSRAGERMRAILREPTFQAIEGIWRALYQLVREVETGPDLKIYMLDLTLPELVIHLEALKEKLNETGPWSVLAGCYAFGQAEAEVRALRKIAGLAKSVQAPFLAEAIPDEAIRDEPRAAWPEFRRSPEAVWIGLALPRFLLRLPYGKDTRPIESFDFEEMPESAHSGYLWGNPVFLCASLLANGWEMESNPRRVDGLPLHICYEDGEAVAKPCAEVLLSHSEAEYLLEQGVMPLVSVKDQDAAVLMRFQSVAEPLQPLPGF